MTLIEINGPSAVGKTSIAKLLLSPYKGQLVEEIHVSQKNPFSKFNDEASFLNNQIWVFERYLQRLKGLEQKASLQIIDIGLIEILAFSKYYPVIKNLDWNITEDFVKMAQGYDITQSVSDILVFLDGTEATLIRRKQQDASRPRSHHRQNLQIASYQRLHLMNLKKTWYDRIFFVDADKDLTRVFEAVKQIIDTAKPATPSITINSLLKEVFCI